MIFIVLVEFFKLLWESGWVEWNLLYDVKKKNFINYNWLGLYLDNKIFWFVVLNILRFFVNRIKVFVLEIFVVDEML